jgi:hypothetical protein
MACQALLGVAVTTLFDITSDSIMPRVPREFEIHTALRDWPYGKPHSLILRMSVTASYCRGVTMKAPYRTIEKRFEQKEAK